MTFEEAKKLAQIAGRCIAPEWMCAELNAAFPDFEWGRAGNDILVQGKTADAILDGVVSGEVPHDVLTRLKLRASAEVVRGGK